MSKTNCVNCGAAKDMSELKCPFCGTTYLDLTAIDFDSGDPVVCQFVLPHSGRTVMSMLARPMLEEFSVMYDTPYTIEGFGKRPYVQTAPDINVGILFKPLEKPDGTICTFRKEE